MKNDLSFDIPCAKAAGRPKAADLEARAQNLLHTAGQLFLKYGYGKVSLEMIAREAHVAVRTIYVKFGGKAGLFNAILQNRRDAYFHVHDMDEDTRPLREIVDDFARHFFELITSPAALSIQRMVIAEARSNPELAQTYAAAGPQQTRDMITRFFARPDIRAQLRPDVAPDLLPTFLLTSVMGDQYARYMYNPSPEEVAESARRMAERLELFYRAVLLAP
jgi:TetR/AcrR family transcriptional repressor of mexJK operon